MEFDRVKGLKEAQKISSSQENKKNNQQLSKDRVLNENTAALNLIRSLSE